MVLGLFGVTWVMPHTVLGLLRCWQGSFGRYRNGYIWSIIPHCLLWCLWRERNGRCFEDIERSIPDLKLLFFRTLRVGCLLCKINHSLLFLISQTLAIFVFDFFSLVHSLCTRVFLFYQYILLLIKKKNLM